MQNANDTPQPTMSFNHCPTRMSSGASLRSVDIPRISVDALQEAHPAYPVPRLMRRSDCEALLTELLPGAYQTDYLHFYNGRYDE